MVEGAGVGSPCTLLLLASSSVFSSGLESSAGLRCSERAFSLCLSPTSFFVLSTVCFLPPDLMCVPLGGCANIRLCLICESDSRDHISGRASYAQGQALQGRSWRVWEPESTALRQCLGMWSSVARIIAVFKNKVFTLENQGGTEMSL